MDVKALPFDEDRGVSPVIGVILMVAITVILAAVIATFVMNMGPETNQPANAQWDGEFSIEDDDHDSFTLTHDSGDAATASEYVLSVSGAEIDGDDGDRNIKKDDVNTDYSVEDLTGSDELSATDTAELTHGDVEDTVDGDKWDGGDLDLSDATVQLIWQDPDSDQTQVVDEWEP